MFKCSKYNIVYKLSEEKYLVANSLYGTKCKIISNIPPNRWEMNKAESSVLSILAEKKLIVPAELDEEQYNQYLCSKKLYSNEELRLQVVLGYLCNFECTYCWQSHTNECDLSETIQTKLPKFLNTQLKKRKRLSLDWIGGEPLLYSGVIEKLSEQFISLAEKHHCTYSAAMTTNGFLLDESMLMRMIHRSRINCFMITLDGTEYTHNLFRLQKGGNNSFQVVKENINNLLVNKPRHVSVVIRINVSPELLGYEEGIAEIYNSFLHPHNLIYLAVPTVDARNNQIKISFNEYFQFCIKLRKLGVPIRQVYELKFMSGVCSGAYDGSYTFTEDGIKKCIQGSTKLTIDEFYHGKMYVETSEWMRQQWQKECKECKLLPMCQGLVCPARKGTCHLKMVLDPNYGLLLDDETISVIHI